MIHGKLTHYKYLDIIIILYFISIFSILYLNFIL